MGERRSQGMDGVALLDATSRSARPLSRAESAGKRAVKDDEPLSASESADLLAAVAGNGDRGAFARLFQHFAPRLKTYLMRQGAPAAAAEEIVQEAMLAVWRKAAYFDPALGSASTWVFTIARNLRIDAGRRAVKMPMPLPDPSEEPEPVASGEEQMIAAEREARVRAALGRLSAEQSTIVHLSFFHEKPQAEIARELGIPLGTVKSRVRLAMVRFRTLLSDLS